ncbi:hypothetical protein [Phenylobacterium sp.]|uniref:hypothetical protein n=1 Tax=Phenylobacterium sp. TaxID=1871053 RepID=UPI002DE6F3C5|nr:hypothetical protein [Phenylobacterium sp.]
MTRERFESLAEAYGGDVSRWPAPAREAAALMMASEPGFTQAALARAGALDAALDAWRPAHAGQALLARILAAAPRARRRGWIGWLSPAALGAGLAAACVAGVMVGVELSQHTSAAREVAVTNTLTAVSSSLDLEEGA